MASALPKTDLRRVRELGKYNEESGSKKEDGRPHETSRVLEINNILCCDGCGKFMDKVKSRFVCSCKGTIHCSKACFKSSNHECQEPWEDLPEENIDGLNDHATVVCAEQYAADMLKNQGPSSDKITHFNKIVRGHKRILKYAEAKNPTAALIIGKAYMHREFDRQAVFAIPLNYKEQSKEETDKIAIKWLTVAAEGGLPDAMFLLFTCFLGNRLNWREGQFWLAEAHATGKMEYLSQILETPSHLNFSAEFDFMINKTVDATLKQTNKIGGGTLAGLLVATRFQEIKGWAGKTALGKPFYGWDNFKKLMELFGELNSDEAKPSFIVGEKKTLVMIIASPGFLDLVHTIKVERDENNFKLKHGVKDEASPDFQLAAQTSNGDGRTSYLVACEHHNIEEDVIINYKVFKRAGTCQSCIEVAKQRLKAVSLGLFSISTTPVCVYLFYAARYAKEDGVIVQEIFRGYSKPYIKQTLQCLMTNPQDLHPLAVAENTILFWPIIWFWGSVHAAVRDCCDKATLDAIYGSLGPNISMVKNDTESARTAFPEDAAGEWRIACGNEDCPRVDHQVKFNLCEGCKVRRYCGPVCQGLDWPKHKQFCRAGKKEFK